MVRDQVIAAIRADRAAKALAAAADVMLARLRAGETLSVVAASQQLVPSEMANMPRGAPMPHAAASEAYFTAPAPTAGKVSPGKAALPDGSIVLFVVSKVTPGNLAEVTPQERAMLQQQLAQASGSDDARAYAAALRRQMQVEVAEERL